MVSSLSPAGLLDRRGFLAAAGAAGLAGCHGGESPVVRIIFGSGTGAGSIDVLRLFVRSLAKAGIAATIEAVPRGGGKLAAQMLAEGPRDGSMIAQLPSGLVYAQSVVEEGFHNDMASFEWIGSYAIDRRVLMVTRESGVTSFDQLLTRPQPITVPARSSQGPANYESAIIRHLTGAHIKAVPGFSGGSRTLSVISGECDGIISALDGIAKLLDLPGARILLRLNDLPLPPGLPNVPREGVPALRDLARGPDADPLCQLVAAHAQLGRMLALPPETPGDIVAMWRQRFDDVLADSDFRRDVAALRFELHNQSGQSVAEQLWALSQRQVDIEPAVRRALAS